ncbi:MAG: hypothetical protein QXS63_05045 [Zestosphaera sp.]
MSSSLESDIAKYVEAYESVREYLKTGGDMTYAFLNMAKLDLEIASKYINDPYCRRQVLKELKALEKALAFAMLANEWKLGLGGITHKLRLISKAIIEILRLALIHYLGL